MTGIRAELRRDCAARRRRPIPPPGACRQVEIVERIAGRVVRRDVECVEIVVDVFDFRAARDRKAEAAEEVDQLVGGLRERMAVSQPGADARQGDVDRPCRRWCAAVEPRPGGFERGFERALVLLNFWPYSRRAAGSSDLSRSCAALSRPCFWPRNSTRAVSTASGVAASCESGQPGLLEERREPPAHRREVRSRSKGRKSLRPFWPSGAP